MVRKLIASRPAVGALTFIVTAVVASITTWLLTVRHYERTFTEGMPMQAVFYANAASQIAVGNTESAQKALGKHADITLAAYASRSMMFDHDADRHTNALRNVATYFALESPDDISVPTRELLSQYSPFSSEELESSSCKSGICELGRLRHGTAEPAK